MSAFSGRDGFVATEAGPAAHFGNPVGEQRALASGRAVVELGLGVVTVSGPDRLSWLNSITSQLLTGLEPGVSTETLVLDQSGRVEHAARVVDDGEITWLLTEPADAAPLAAWLDSMRFMLRVEVTDRSADLVTLGRFAGSAAPDGVVVEWVDPWSSVTPGGWGYAAPEAHPASDWTLRIDVVTPDAVAALAASDTPVAGLLAFEACASPRGGPRSRTSTSGRSRTSSTGSAPPCTCRRVATAGRRPSPRCTTSGTRRAAW